MTQTAVEWLSKKTFIPVYLLEQAKEMEKEQIIDAHNYGFTEGNCFGASPIRYIFIESEQYFNETYKSE